MTHQPTQSTPHTAGFSLVEVLVVSALVVLMFGGLLASVQYVVTLVLQSKAESGAHALALARLEYVRSLPYETVGTEGGIPDGPLTQYATTTLNEVTYTERTLVQFRDRPEDGLGTEDENSITADSKVVKVTYTFDVRGRESELSLSADIVPRGIETTEGGGTLAINVFDASVQPLQNAEVRVYNETGTSTIDVTVETNDEGVAYFPGAPALTSYELSATRAGYSTDSTYAATATNTNPNPPHVSVVESEVSTVHFSIDELGSLSFYTHEPPVNASTTDLFDTFDHIESTTGATIDSGELRLSGSPGSYSATGTARSVALTNSPLLRFERVEWERTVPADTSLYVQVASVDGSGTSTTYTLLSDAVLPGNSSGFTSKSIDLTDVDSDTYPNLALIGTFSTNGAETPTVDFWRIVYTETEAPLSDVSLTVHGTKTIGEFEDAPVYKYDVVHTTDANGEISIPSLEWDSYEVVIDGAAEGYIISEVSPFLPIALDPGAAASLDLTLVPYTTPTLRIGVSDSGGVPIAEASIVLVDESGAPTYATTSTNGQVLLTGLSETEMYTLEVSKSGYDTYTDDAVPVEGNDVYTVTLQSM